MRGYLIQVGMCFGGERVIHEKKFQFNFGYTSFNSEKLSIISLITR